MLAALIPLLRPLVIWVVQITTTTIIADFVAGLLKRIVEGVAEHYGLTEADSKLVVVNKIIDVAALVGIGTAVLYKKLGITAVKYLGIEGTGLVRRTIGDQVIKKIATKEARSIGIPSVFKKIKSWVIGDDPTGFLMRIMVLQQMGDWYFFKRGLLQETIDKILGKDTINLPGENEAPPGFTKAEWNGFVSSIESVGVFGFKGITNGVMGLYNREQLVTLGFWVYGQQIKSGGSTGPAALQKGLREFLVFKGTTAPLSSSTQANTSSASQVVPQTKVFTGIVSQGTVGSGLQFTARPDDLIESASELQQAINNNVSSYLATLLGKVTYEIKVVSSVIVGGIRKTGTSQRIQSGSFANGTPKYKSVTNKFAVADLYLITDRGTRSKLTSIVLGPVDALKFQPTSDDLVGVASSVSRNILTSNTDEIDKIVTSTPTLVVPPASAEDSIEAPGVGYCVVYDGYQGTICFNKETVSKLRLAVAKNEKTLDQAENELRLSIDMGGQDTWANNGAKNLGPLWQLASPKVRSILSTGGTFAGTPQQTQAGVSPPVTAPFKDNQTPANALPVQSLPEVALTAPNLYEFYGALGRQLPTLTERGDLYQSLGLGQAAFYTGTAEQNTKLLATLKLKGV